MMTTMWSGKMVDFRICRTHLDTVVLSDIVIVVKPDCEIAF